MKILVGQVPSKRPALFQFPTSSHYCATIVQHQQQQNSDRAEWHEQDRDVEEVRGEGNFADAKTFPPRHAGANAKWGLIQCMTRGRGDR
jgi:hypothetical protein